MTLKDITVYMLEKSKGNFVSGQEIADRAGVSRSAVGKCIKALKDEGYDITSVNNSGHRLENSCNIISASGIRALIPEGETPVIKTFKTVDSTNNEAKRAVAEGLTEDAIFVSDEQTAGRGRSGKSFYSPKKSGLYFTSVLHPDTFLADTACITAAAAVAVAEAIMKASGKEAKIKWVNDVFVGNRKVCGILTEAITDFESMKVQAVIVGIGINLTTEFPEGLDEIAGAVGDISRNALASEIYLKLKEYCLSLPRRDFMDKYRKYSLVIGKNVSFVRNGEFYKAKALAITDSGALVVETDGGDRMELASGEVSVTPDNSEI